MTTTTDPMAPTDVGVQPASESDFTPPADDPAWRDLQKYDSETSLLKVLSDAYPDAVETYRGWADRGSLRRNTYYAAKAEEALPQEARDALADAGLMSSPAVLGALAHLGRSITTAAHSIPTASLADQLDAEIAQLQAEHFGKPSYGQPQVQNRLRSLFQRRYPSGA